MLNSIYLYQSVSLSPSSLSVPSSFSHLLPTFLSSSLPVTTYHHQSIQCIGYSALLKIYDSHFWWDALPFPDLPHWLTNNLYFLVYKIYFNPWRRYTIFSTDCVSSKNFKYVWSKQFDFVDVFMAFNLWIGGRFFFNLVNNL